MPKKSARNVGAYGPADYEHVLKDTPNFNKDTHDTSDRASIPEATNVEIKAILKQLEEPITAAPLQTAIQEEYLNENWLLWDSQLSTTLPCKDIILHESSQIPAQRPRKPSRFHRSPFVEEFSSEDKGKGKMPYNQSQKFPFDGFGICYDPPLDLIEDFRIWVEKGLLIRHAKRIRTRTTTELH